MNARIAIKMMYMGKSSIITGQIRLICNFRRNIEIKTDRWVSLCRSLN